MIKLLCNYSINVQIIRVSSSCEGATYPTVNSVVEAKSLNILTLDGNATLRTRVSESAALIMLIELSSKIYSSAEL